MYALLQGWYISWERLHLLSGVWAGGGGGWGGYKYEYADLSRFGWEGQKSQNHRMCK